MNTRNTGDINFDIGRLTEQPVKTITQINADIEARIAVKEGNFKIENPDARARFEAGKESESVLTFESEQDDPERAANLEALLADQEIRAQGLEGVPMTSLPGSSMYYNDNVGMRGASIVNKDGSTTDFGGYEAIDNFAIEYNLQDFEIKTLKNFDALADKYRTENPEVTAFKLRKAALSLLREAHAIDGLKPYLIIHEHRFGTDGHIRWSDKELQQDEIESSLDGAFDVDREEKLTISNGFGLDDLTGVSPLVRVDYLLKSEDLEKAKGLVSDKDNSWLANRVDGSLTIGKVLGQTEHYVVQNLGRNAVIHDKANLTSMPNDGDIVEINYQKVFQCN